MRKKMLVNLVSIFPTTYEAKGISQLIINTEDIVGFESKSDNIAKTNDVQIGTENFSFSTLDYKGYNSLQSVFFAEKILHLSQNFGSIQTSELNRKLIENARTKTELFKLEFGI